MAYIIKDEQEEISSEVVIYAITSPFDEKKVYVGRTSPDRLKRAYSEHYNLRVSKTKDLFAFAKENDLIPPIYHLEEGEMTQKESFKRCIAWVKYFLDRGYSQMKTDTLTEYANSLAHNTEQYYNQIKDEPLSEIIKSAGGLFPNYGRREKSKARNTDNLKMIAVRLNEEEYAAVKDQALKQGLPMATYCKRMAVNGKIIRPDFSFLGDYLDSFTYVHDLLQKVLYSICSSGNYYPADMENIQKCLDRVVEIEKSANEKIAETIRTLREQEQLYG